MQSMRSVAQVRISAVKNLGSATHALHHGLTGDVRVPLTAMLPHCRFTLNFFHLPRVLQLRNHAARRALAVGFP